MQTKREQLPSMQKAPLVTNAGFSLVEVVLATAVFGLLVTALVGTFLYGQESTVLAGSRARAGMLAEEGLEATRNMRDSALTFANLPDSAGTGLSITLNQWGFSGSTDTNTIFTRQTVVSTVDTYRKNVTTNVTWQQNAQRAGSISVVTRVTDWMRSSACTIMGDCLSVNISGVQLDSTDNTSVIGITLANTGGTNIIIDTMTISWTGGPNGDNDRRIVINGVTAWSGNGKSGDVLDITNFTLNAASTYPLTSLGFKKNMTGTTISIVFAMTDGSTKTITGIQP